VRTSVLALATLVVATASACTWVALTPEAQEVRLADVADVSACEKIGKVNTTTAQKAGLFPRSHAKVQQELATLARNEAAKMGGDTVAGVSDVRDGGRTFNVYRCRGDGD
jgi:hypothetical protein